MLSLKEYIIESLISEAIRLKYYKYNKRNPKYNFNIVSTGGHAAEQDMIRSIKTYEVINLIKDTWHKLLPAIKSGKILINQRNSKKRGSSVCLHSSEKTKSGFLVVVIFISKYYEDTDVYDIEVVTTWKGKHLDSYKKGDADGHSMYHPEYGQIDVWDDIAVKYNDKVDDI